MLRGARWHASLTSDYHLVNVTDLSEALPAILRSPVARPRIVAGFGALARLGELAQTTGGARVMLVTDPGLVAAGHAGRAVDLLGAAGLAVAVFSGTRENPTEAHVNAGVEAARAHDVDLLVGLGGGSAMDCAKGVNFVLTNGGRMRDYWGVGKATRPMLPLIAVPTTAGTGSEAQSFALIADPVTHQKMACGDKKALPQAAILDPELTATVPPGVAAATGIDAVSHAVETSATSRRTDESRALSRAAWTMIERSFERIVRGGTAEAPARADMLIGAHLAGAAIERSMLGAAHACANPLTARFGIVHGVAVGLMLPHVVRFNGEVGANPYADLCQNTDDLAARLDAMLLAADLPRRLADIGVPSTALPELAAHAAQQWTAQFNPRPVGEAECLAIYRAAS